MTNTMKRLAVLLIGTLFVLCVAIVLAVSMPVSTAFAAEGEPEATVHDHTDGTWTELTADGGTLQSGNYYLAGDVTLSTDITIADNATVTLCLNGHMLIGTGTSSVITFNEGVDFTLTDCQSASEAAEHQHAYYINSDGLYVFDNGTEEWSAAYEAAENKGTVTGGVITGGNAATGKGGGVYAQGTFTMSGGAISGNSADNSADSWGGGVYVSSGGTFTMSGGMISGNRTMYNGGGVCVDGTFTMSGGTISGNTASIDGGGVCVYGTFTMSGGTISDNMAADFVGGVYVLGGTFTMTGGTISGNTASSNCGGVYVLRGTFTMTGGTISGNTAQNGGGVYVLDGEFTMTGGTISGNTVSWFGSGVYVYASANDAGKFTMTGGYLGGEIWNNGTVSISGGYFSEPPAEAFIADGHAAYDISVYGTALDSDYIEGFPYAVYKSGAGLIPPNVNDNIIYDGSPVEEGTDFTVTGADGMTLGYRYKQEGGEYVSGLPTDAGEYTILACALDYAQKTYYETTFELNIQKAAPSYTKPTDIKACVEQTLADIKLPEDWEWQDPSLGVGNETGEKQFKAIFTPEDTSNYNTVEESVTVTVTAHTVRYEIRRACTSCLRPEGHHREIPCKRSDLYAQGNVLLFLRMRREGHRNL